MSDFAFNILLFFGYLLGVFVSMVIIAWHNSRCVLDMDKEEPMQAALSWIFVAMVLIILLAGLISIPFECLYDKIKKYIDEHTDCKDRL